MALIWCLPINHLASRRWLCRALILVSLSACGAMGVHAEPQLGGPPVVEEPGVETSIPPPSRASVDFLSRANASATPLRNKSYVTRNEVPPQTTLHAPLQRPQARPRRSLYRKTTLNSTLTSRNSSSFNSSAPPARIVPRRLSDARFIPQTWDEADYYLKKSIRQARAAELKPDINLDSRQGWSEDGTSGMGGVRLSPKRRLLSKLLSRLPRNVSRPSRALREQETLLHIEKEEEANDLLSTDDSPWKSYTDASVWQSPIDDSLWRPAELDLALQPRMLSTPAFGHHEITQNKMPMFTMQRGEIMHAHAEQPAIEHADGPEISQPGASTRFLSDSEPSTAQVKELSPLAFTHSAVEILLQLTDAPLWTEEQPFFLTAENDPALLIAPSEYDGEALTKGEAVRIHFRGLSPDTTYVVKLNYSLKAPDFPQGWSFRTKSHTSEL